jgi:hypothetical protein
MKKMFTTDIPRYEIRSPGWEHLEVFDSLSEAYQSVFDFALKHPDTEFFIVKKVSWEEEIIFKLKCNLAGGINNVQEFYKSMISLFQLKLAETMPWRREDGC